MTHTILRKETPSPEGVITLFTITNSIGASVGLSTLGAGITRIAVPDRNGRLTEVVLGYDDIADYIRDSPCAGKTSGRFANRISGARFSIDGTTYHLSRNDGANSLHGGPDGFHNRIWDYEIIDRGVRFTRLSPDGEEGYPGSLHTAVTYKWDDDCCLDISYEALTDAATVVNLTNHAYFNLNGCGHILRHLLMINSHERVQSDARDIPTGAILPVEGTPFDFRTPKEIGRDINADFENLVSGKGYNHYFLIDRNDTGALTHAASLYSPISGIRLDVGTDMPGLMLYTGNWLDGSPTGRGGIVYHDHDGVAIECQFPPDAPNRPDFPSALLRPGEMYRHTIRYTFSQS
ncbi:MAG: galactose mutarotase [Muribaculaceae bacterium]|nr:galactose mutarotase [Muribaculaceae bacterium]